METDSPVIVQASRGGRQYAGDIYLSHLVSAAVEMHPHIPVAMHQDHGNCPATCLDAINRGFTSVMMDGSLREDGKTPSDYVYNVRVTKEVVEAAHARGVTVEGELGCLGGVEDGHGAGLTSDETTKHLTDPAQAEVFVEETGIDALTVAIGTSHGAYKFSSKPNGDVLAMDIIEKIHRRLPNCHLVMHGSSCVPTELLNIIRRYGGEMKKTHGVPIAEIQRGIKHGVRKINIDTDNRLAMVGAIRRIFTTRPGEFDLRKYLGEARAAMQKVCVDRMISFGQAGNAGKIKPKSCREMAIFYKQ